jgi:cytochrome c biogenesis protein
VSVSTHGLRLKNTAGWVRNAVELLSAMRFAIALLSVICIASIIGTVLKQQEPINNYINQFGPFWADVFGKLGLFAVYSAWWFLLILLFLVISTSLCVGRNTPQILRDLQNFKEHLREASFKAFSHNALWNEASQPADAVAHIHQAFASIGWKTKTQERQGDANGQGRGTLIAAKAGGGHKMGYIAAHSAIVLVCIGGLLDGDMLTRAQMWWGNKVVHAGGGMIADVPPASRLPASNPAYRANLLVAEGQTAGTAILQQPTGVLLQELPFSIELKKFVVEHYSTGMPKLFASDIIIHDKTTGAKTTARVEVNHPVNYQGVNIFQSSFDDGGSSVKLQAVPIATASNAKPNAGGATAPLRVEGVIGGSTPLTNGAEKLTLEFVALRVLNVETFAKKDLRNVGPSITYKLRDAAGQAREFHNYMLPIQFLDSETPVHMVGVRDTPAEPFKYWRIPSDDKGGIDGFLKLAQAVQSPAAIHTAIGRYLAKAADPSKPELRAALQTSAERVMSLFAGRAALGLQADKPADQSTSGLQAIADFLEKNVPEDQRVKTSEVLIRILNGVLYELAAKDVIDADVRDKADWLNQAVLALSDAKSYPAPMIFQLKDFTQVQASVFQVAKAPGQTIVYLGAVLLIIGVFFMLYIRERRVWVWVKAADSTDDGSHISMAYATNRKTMNSDQEFERLVLQLKV